MHFFGRVKSGCCRSIDCKDVASIFGRVNAASSSACIDCDDVASMSVARALIDVIIRICVCTEIRYEALRSPAEVLDPLWSFCPASRDTLPRPTGVLRLAHPVTGIPWGIPRGCRRKTVTSYASLTYNVSDTASPTAECKAKLYMIEPDA